MKYIKDVRMKIAQERSFTWMECKCEWWRTREE